MFTLQISKQYAIKELIFMALAFFFGYQLIAGADSSEFPGGEKFAWFYPFWVGFLFASAVAGWRLLFANRNRQTIFIGSGGQYLVYIGFKFFIAMMAGLYLMPFVLFRDIRAIVRNQI